MWYDNLNPKESKNGPIHDTKQVVIIWLSLATALILGGVVPSLVRGAEPETVEPQRVDFATDIKPIFAKFCFDCHGDGADEGGLTLDSLLAQSDRTADQPHWLAVWSNLQAQTMPPSTEEQPSLAERQALIRWIQRDVFQLDPSNPDPGRVTIRRLNREEYRNTINDLLGVEFDTTEAFPADDTGYGFDTIGDVLSISPLLMEKYIEAAQQIVAEAVYTAGPQIPTLTVWADQFRSEDKKSNARWLPFETPVAVSNSRYIEHAGRYRIKIEMRVSGSMEATLHTAVLTVKANGKELNRRNLGWDYSKAIYLTAEADLSRGSNLLSLELAPKNPPGADEDPLRLAVRKVELYGPLGGSYTEYPPVYQRVFVDGPPPTDAAAREQYARKLLRHFADHAFRRPVDEPTLDRLVALAVDVEQSGMSFEHGIAQALTAILASPRFLFRAEVQPEPNDPGQVVTLDEFALASRLSYFLWSSLPDDELFDLARQGKLRTNLRSQVDRMLADPRSERFVANFVGQWLQTRDVETLNVDARRILEIRSTEDADRIFNQRLRSAMARETEMLVADLMRENGTVLDLLTADYTFANESLAKWYGIDGVQGDQMRKVSLPPDAHRSGILTHASFLIVTSNPTRTSPVKRGQFILENLLGTPAPPPPPDVPELEQAARGRGRNLTMRELMAVHRQQPLCASCHSRMDPLGLALENYNALGMFRETDRGKPIDTAGQLMTGEKFADVKELSRVLATDRRGDFYRCLTEKLLTYAIGRGVEYYDAPTVDKIVAQLDQDGGKMRALIYGIVESVPFQKRRGDGDPRMK